MLVVVTIAVTALVATPKASAIIVNPDNTEMSAVVVPATYTVVKGDSLAKIASDYSATWQSLYCANQKMIGTNPNAISPGERLTIPFTVISCKIVLPAVKKVVTDSIVRPASASTATVTAVAVASQEPSGSLQSYAEQLTGSAQEFSCLNSIIMAESSWNVYIANTSSGAYGIPQALPGSKMSVAGSDWATNGYTQLRWMVDDYIDPTYQTACNAWEFHLAHGWY